MSPALARLFFLVVAAGFAFGPAQGAAQSSGASSSILRPGDVLELTVWPDSVLSGSYRVEESGEVYLPVVGSVNVLDRPLPEIRADLLERFGSMMRNPVVVVVPRFRINLIGALRQPGLYLAEPTMTFLDAVGLAGGFLPEAATDEIRLIRNGTSYSVDAEAFLSGRTSQVIGLQSGDIIEVPEKGGLGSRGWQVVLQFANVALAVTAILLNN